MKGLILIGGKSQRMGSDKYLMDIHGLPQYLHLYELLSSFQIDVYVSCSQSQQAEIDDETPKIVDTYNAIGPMGGVISAMGNDPKSSWLVVACDLMNLTKESVQNLMGQQDKAYDVIAYQKPDNSFFETTITIYNPSAHSVILKQVHAGDYSLQSALQKLTVKEVVPEDFEALKNFNHPKDLS
ncbi:molybdenum cofactor guanylyltransferase [Marinoscillum sp. MHG1-6]|uniref:molybdenum cofactor guanylyltransferase n=1 Tax=Marinoscillum sp. MHG1-6 TaxID=2959627 RepID=UPI0021574EE9|nr:molybdenum cofactor guanylyltransferase [Marinoscillum sp. MHG1-6]